MPTQHLQVRLAPGDIDRATARAKERSVASELTARSLAVRLAIAEAAVARALHRPYDGEFRDVATWDAFRAMERPPKALEVRLPSGTTDRLVLSEIDQHRGPIILVLDREAPTYTLAGWILGKDGADERFRQGKVFILLPHDLRPAWELRAPERVQKHRGDPAKDFGGIGRVPYQLDTDTLAPPAEVSEPYPARYALPCRRCQLVVPVGALASWSAKTGWIHGSVSDCPALRRKVRPATQ